MIYVYNNELLTKNNHFIAIYLLVQISCSALKSILYWFNTTMFSGEVLDKIKKKNKKAFRFYDNLLVNYALLRYTNCTDFLQDIYSFLA